MNDNSHASTPGPWVVRSGYVCHSGVVAVCQMRDETNEAANAALIAAAPDLLAALKAFVPICTEHQKTELWVRHDQDGELRLCDDCHAEWLVW
jgi:hypothetical protein